MWPAGAADEAPLKHLKISVTNIQLDDLIKFNYEFQHGMNSFD